MAVESTIGGSNDLFVGEDKVIRFELLDVNDVPVDMTGWVMRFDVRLKDKSPDPAILFVEPMSITGSYNVNRTMNTQRAIVALTDTQMNLFKEKPYRWSWKRMDDGSETVLGLGDFKPEKATAP